MPYKEKNHEFQIGQLVELTQNVESVKGFFEKGDLVTVCDISIKGYGFEDDEGNKVIECGFDCCEKHIPEIRTDRLSEEVIKLISSGWKIMHPDKELDKSEIEWATGFANNGIKKYFKKQHVKIDVMDDLIDFLVLVNEIEIPERKQ